jgi:hypothetical protein
MGADFYFSSDILVAMSSGKSSSYIGPASHLDLFGL